MRAVQSYDPDMLPDLTRRRLLGLTIVTAGSLLGATGCGSDGGAPAREASRFFPQSVASGDPRPTSVVLWTRAVDPERPDADLELELELGADPDFTEVFDFGAAGSPRLTAEAAFDHCVRVRVEDLEPATTYYYRFRHRGSGGAVASPTGRTRTAPDADSDARVRFAVVSCQDYDGKFFHAYRALLARDVDFVVHLGDYVYESHAPAPESERAIVFGRPEEALARSATSVAARSLDNYRDLYRTVRQDPDLRAAHERFPFIAIWDDHEFSDDCHGATGTYSDGRRDETDLERRRAADQAWFEYMPVDYSEPPASAFDPSRAFPDDFAIYRSFAFGRHLELAMTDSRRYRPDHLVPEDAFPGAVFVTEEELVAAGAPVPGDLVPTIEIESFADGVYRDALAARAAELELDPEALVGRVSVLHVNALLAGLGGDIPEPIDPELPGLARGYAFHQILKTAPFASMGSRYLVALEPFLALARKRYAESGGASERLLGDAQRAWLVETLRASTRTFKVWGSELAFMPRHLDLRGVESVPAELRARLAISAEDWDGCPNERAALHAELADAGNVVILSGDLHCFFVGTPFDAAAPERRLVELTTGSISSTTWLRAVGRIIADAGVPDGVAMAVSAVGSLLSDRVARPNPHLAFHELEQNGFSVLEAHAGALEMELVFVSPEDVATETLPAPIEERIRSERFRVPADGSGLQREIGDGFWRWDTETMAWVAL